MWRSQRNWANMKLDRVWLHTPQRSLFKSWRLNSYCPKWRFIKFEQKELFDLNLLSLLESNKVIRFKILCIDEPKHMGHTCFRQRTLIEELNWPGEPFIPQLGHQGTEKVWVWKAANGSYLCMKRIRCETLRAVSPEPAMPYGEASGYRHKHVSGYFFPRSPSAGMDMRLSGRKGAVCSTLLICGIYFGLKVSVVRFPLHHDSP